MNKPIIEYNDFEKIEILTGTIVEVTENVKARKPAYVLKINFGEKVGIKFSSAQITTVLGHLGTNFYQVSASHIDMAISELKTIYGIQ